MATLGKMCREPDGVGGGDNYYMGDSNPPANLIGSFSAPCGTFPPIFMEIIG